MLHHQEHLIGAHIPIRLGKDPQLQTCLRQSQEWGRSDNMPTFLDLQVILEGCVALLIALVVIFAELECC